MWLRGLTDPGSLCASVTFPDEYQPLLCQPGPLGSPCFFTCLPSLPVSGLQKYECAHFHRCSLRVCWGPGRHWASHWAGDGQGELWATGRSRGIEPRQQSSGGRAGCAEPGCAGEACGGDGAARSLPGREGQGKGGSPCRVFTAGTTVCVPGSECVRASVCLGSSRDHPSASGGRHPPPGGSLATPVRKRP